MNQVEKKENKKKVSKTKPTPQTPPPVVSPKPSPTDQISQLQKELSELKSWKENNLRKLAEQLNHLREIEEQKKQEIIEFEKYGKQTLLTEIVDFIINLESVVIKTMHDYPDPQGIVLSQAEAIEISLNNLKRDLEREGVREMEIKVGVDLRNISFHKCFKQVVDPKLATGTIIEVVKKGYLLHDRVLRMAEVKISKKQKEN